MVLMSQSWDHTLWAGQEEEGMSAPGPFWVPNKILEFFLSETPEERF